MTDPNTGLLALALEAARRAGDFLRDGRPADLAVAATKTSAIDVVTEMDIASEKMITGFASSPTAAPRTVSSARRAPAPRAPAA